METEKRLIDAYALSEKIGNMKFEITHNRGGYRYCNEDEKSEWDKLDGFDSLVCEAPTVRNQGRDLEVRFLYAPTAERRMSMPKNCDTCKYDLFRLCGDEDKTPCDDCYNGNPPTKWEPGENYEPKTNADRIRAMSDEELVKFIEDTGVAGCPEPARSCRASCTKCIMEWLQQPCEEDI